MSGRYHVVGCSTCDCLWLLDDDEAAETVQCPRCGERFDRDGRNTLAAADDLDAARTHRSRRLAERAHMLNGTGVRAIDLGDDRHDYAALADRRQERWAARNAAFADAATAASEQIEATALREHGIPPDRLDDVDDVAPGGTDREARLLGVANSEALAAAADRVHERSHDLVARELGFASADQLEATAEASLDASAEPTDAAATSDQPAVEATDSAEAPEPGEASPEAGPGEAEESSDAPPSAEPDEQGGDGDGADDSDDGDDPAGIRFVRQGDQPPVADVTIEASPRVSEWLPDLLEETLSRTASTARDEIAARDRGLLRSNRLSQSIVRAFRAEHGITAQRGTYADTIANYALWFAPDASPQQALADPAFRAEKWEATWRAQLTSIGQRGGSGDVALGEDWYEDLVEGPLAVHDIADDRGTYVVHPDTAEWLDADRETLGATLDALVAWAAVDRVYVVLQSSRLYRALEERFGDRLADESNLTEFGEQARDTGMVDADAATRSDADCAHDWVTSTSDGHQEVRVLDAVANAPEQTLSIETLLADPGVDISRNSVYAVKDALVGAGLVEYHHRTSYSESSRLELTTAGALAAEHIDPEYALVDPLSSAFETRLTAPHNATEGAVGSRPQGREGGQGGRVAGTGGFHPPSAEDWLAERGTEAFAADSQQYVQWLDGPGGALAPYGMHRRYAAPAAGPGVWLADDRIPYWNGRDEDAPGDGRAVFVSNAVDDELLVLFQWAWDPLVSLARIANALLSNRVAARVLNREVVGPEFEKLYDGAYDAFVDSLEGLHTDLVRDSAQVGWWGEDQHTWDGWRRRWGALRPQLMERVGKLAGTDDWDARGELMADLQGVIASATQLLYAAGQDVVINVRIPDTAELVEDEFYKRYFMDFLASTVPKQAVYESGTGYHSWWRQTCEERPEKLKWRRSPGIDEDHPTATLTAAWIITGPGATGLQEDVQRAVDRGVRERADGQRAPPALEVPVQDATAPQAVRAIVEDLATAKSYGVADAEATISDERRVDRGKAADVTRVMRLLYAGLGTEDRPLSCSPYDVAETLLHVASSSRVDDYLRVRDLEYGFSQLPPERFLPTLPASTAAFVQALLAADEPLQRGEICERAGFSTRSWEERRGELLGVCLVESRRQGRHPRYVATMEPWWIPESPRSKPPHVGRDLPGNTDMDDSWTEGTMLWEISMALGLSIWDSELFSDGSVPAAEIYQASAELRRWRPLVQSGYAGRADLLGLPPPPERHEVVMLGRYPDGVESRGAGDQLSQATLGAPQPLLDLEEGNRNTAGNVGRNKME